MTTRAKIYKVTYSRGRGFDRVSTKAKALDQARYALRTGNSRACIYVQKLDGSWLKVRCMTKRRGR